MNLKKLILTNLPYALAVWPVSKLAEAVRLSPGADFSAKLLALGDGFGQAFAVWQPSFHPVDLCIGIAGAVLLKLVFYAKAKNAKKYRTGVEYGSARWGTHGDIEPYMDKDFFQNVLLTQTERITISNRPPNPKYARNKNILVIATAGVESSYFLNLLIQLGYDPAKLYNVGSFTTGMGEDIAYRYYNEAKYLIQPMELYDTSISYNWENLTPINRVGGEIK